MKLKRIAAALSTAMLVVALAALTHAQSTSQPRAKAPGQDFGKGAFKSDTAGVTLPKVKTRENPTYTSTAMRAKVQGGVQLEAVVTANGTIGESRVKKSSLTSANDRTVSPEIYAELVTAAQSAAKKWTFEPATLEGKAVPVIIELDMEFRLH